MLVKVFRIILSSFDFYVRFVWLFSLTRISFRRGSKKLGFVTTTPLLRLKLRRITTLERQCLNVTNQPLLKSVIQDSNGVGYFSKKKQLNDRYLLLEIRPDCCSVFLLDSAIAK
jgi:hypothetical protein